MGRKPVPNDHIAVTTSLRDSDEMSTFERDGRTFVSFPDDMFLYERDEKGLLSRVPPDELPPVNYPEGYASIFDQPYPDDWDLPPHRQLRR